MTEKKNKKNNDFNYEDLESRNPKTLVDAWKYDDNYKESFDKETVFNDIDSNISFEEKLYRIVLWKINRRVILNSITEDKIKRLIKSDKKSDIIELIDRLADKNNMGIGLPMASTILHFYSKGKYPILDQRAYRVIYEKEPAYDMKNPGECYYEYYEKCKKYYDDRELKSRGLEFYDIDKYLYQIDLKKGNRNS